MRRAAAAFALTFLVACGGGGSHSGGTGPSSSHLPVDFGVVSAAATTTTSATVHNGTGAATTLTFVSASGPFAVAPGALPVAAPKDADVSVALAVSPAGASGAITGSISLHFDDVASGEDVILDCAATAEVIDVTTPTATLAFGEVPVGAKKDLAIKVENHGAVTTAHVTGATVPAGGFSIVTALPAAVAPGASVDVVVRYAPSAPAAPSGPVVLTTDSPGRLISVPAAATSGGEVATNLGTKTFSSGLTPEFTIDIPADAISFTLEAITSPGTVVGLGLLTGPHGEVFENEATTGDYLQYPDDEVFDAMVPNTDRAALALVPGTWTVKLKRFSGTATTATARLLVQRRPGPTGGVGALDLNVFLASAIGPKAASAASDTNLKDVLARVDTIYSQQGLRLGAVDYYDIADTTYDDVTNAEFPGLLKLLSGAAKTRLNFFFVRTAIGGGVIGESAKIDGPTLNGTWASGVMGIWIENPSASERDLLARVMAHEMGHFLGLLHTVESDGVTHDPIDDTADCGANGCSPLSQLYLMHWNASPGGAVITNGEGLVIRGHPLVSAAVPPGGGAMAAMISARHGEAPIDVWENWCGTCRKGKTAR